MSFPEVNTDYELNDNEREDFIKTARGIATVLFGNTAKKLDKRESLDHINNYASVIQTAMYSDDAVIGFSLFLKYFYADDVLVPEDEYGEVVLIGRTYELNINHNDGIDALELGTGTLSVECGGEADFCVDQVYRSVTDDSDRDIDDELELDFSRDIKLMASDLLVLLDIQAALVQ